jgi:hypothetical protein
MGEVSRLCRARKTAYRLTKPCRVLAHAGRNVQGAFEYRDNKNHPIACAPLPSLEELVFHTAEIKTLEDGKMLVPPGGTNSSVRCTNSSINELSNAQFG